jgi:hypothetical protein
MLATAHLEHASELFQAALAVIKEGRSSQARRTVVDKGQVVDVSPDHSRAVRGGRRLVRILTAERPILKPKEKKENGAITLYELKRMHPLPSCTACWLSVEVSWERPKTGAPPA